MGQSQTLRWMAAGQPNPLDQSQPLYEATLTAFAGHSFQDASLNEILKAAGMNKGSFYYRFSDKMELYLSLLYRVGMEKLRIFEEADVKKTSGGFFDEFRTMAILGLKLAKKDVRFVEFTRRILAEEPSVREEITKCFGSLGGGILTDMVERAKASGEFRADLSTQTAVFVIETLLNHLDAMIPADWTDESVLQAVDRLLDVVRNGVGQS